jgi:hypothetical protein
MASLDKEVDGSFLTESHRLFSDFLYEDEPAGNKTLESFNFDIHDTDAPHFPWSIADDKNYLRFNPLEVTSQLSERIYESTFGELIGGVSDRIGDAA